MWHTQGLTALGMRIRCINVVDLQESMDVTKLLVFTVVSKVIYCYFILVIA